MKPLDPRLLTYAKAARSYIIFLVIVGFAQALFTILQCLAIASVLSPLVQGKANLHELALPLALVVVAFSGKALLIYIQEAFGHRAALRTIADLRSQVLSVSGERGQRWLSEGRTSSTVTLVTEALDDLEPYFVKFLPQLILTTLATPATLVVILYLDWVSALAIIICIPLIPIFMILIGKMTQEYSNERLASMQRLGDKLLDLLAGLSTLKALGREKSPKPQVKKFGDDYAKKTLQTLYLAFLSGAVLEFLATLSTALVAVEVGLRMTSGNLGLFAGLSIIMLTPESLKPLREVGSQFHASADGVAAAEKVFTLLEEEQTSTHKGTRKAPDLRTSTIECTGVSVMAPGRTTIAPHRFDGTFHPGIITVLRGKSGAGKSTLASVILGFVPPDEGSVTVGGIPLQDISLKDLWEQISWVPQRPAIIPGTVLENIGCEESPELERAAQLTGFSDVISSLPHGWRTRIGQAGVGLSVGQRQRLALTRALVDARPLVILDEPSAHLDAVSETFVSNAVKELRDTGHTVIVIAHRSALMEQADLILDVSSSGSAAHNPQSSAKSVVNHD